MTKHVPLQPTTSAPGGDVGQSNPNKQVIKPPRPTTAPGKPARDPNRGGSLGAVEGVGAPQDFSSRLPGESFKVPPS